MTAWWDGLTALQQLFYWIAIPSTVVLLVQTILMIFGLGGHHDVPGGHGPIDGSVGHDIPQDAVVTGHSGMGHGLPAVDAHSAAGYDTSGGHDAADAADLVSFRLFSFQSVLAFLVVFGWTGVALAAGRSVPGAVAVILSLLAGTAALFLTAWMFYALLKLQNSGNVRLSNAVGLTGEVYIPVPAAGRGQGKVNVLVQGRWLECDAVTDAPETVKTMQAVRVIGVRGGSVLVVEPVDPIK